jgi:hypothetical protein
VTHVELTDAASGAPLGAVQRADSVAALSALYGQLTGGWAAGTAASPEIAATFYHDSAPIAVLVLASGGFEARVGGRVFRRPAGPEDALAFARLTGIPIKYGSGMAAAAPPARP